MANVIEIRMNLAAIKRVDPYAKEIVDTSAHVAFYTFNSNENEWEKTDVEGAFFIYSRNADPFHSIFINNRLNTNSFVEPITAQLELQSQPPFLLYRNERSRIRGFWFYNSSECDRIGDLVSRLIKECEGKSILNKLHEIKTSSSNVDIFSMLSKAQENFNNSANQSSKYEGKFPSQHNVTSESVMSFFAAAKPAAASEVPLFQRLLSNPVSVDQIEKQQRTSTPQDGKITPPNTAGVIPPCVYSNLSVIENELNSKKKNSQNEIPDLGSSPLAKFLNCNIGLLGNKKISNNTNILDADNNKNIKFDETQNSSRPALMPPTMFLTSKCKSDDETINEQVFSKPEPLTQTQLLQAMVYLIQHDKDFIKKLHEAYLKSFTDIVSLN